jgi:signal transduction histidine kinase
MTVDRRKLGRAMPRLKVRMPSLASVAWALAATSVLLALSSLILRSENGVPRTGNAVPVGVLIALSYPVVGAAIAARHPRNRVGWIFCIAGLSQAFAEFSFQYASYSLATRPGALPAGVAMAWFSDWAWFPGYALIVTFTPLLFPDGRLPSPRWRVVAWSAGAAMTLLSAAAVATIPLQRGRTSVGQPLEGETAASLLGGAGFALLLATALLCLLSLVFRWRRAQQSERQRIKWFVFSATAGVSLLVSSNFFDGVPYFVLQTLGAAAVPVGTGVAILRHQLYDIDFVINRSVVYGFMTAVVVLGYTTIVAGAEVLFERAGVEASLVAAGVVAVAFQPLRERIQLSVNRVMYGDRDDPYAVLSTLGRRLESAGPAEELLPAVTTSLAHALRLPYVAIELRGDRGSVVAAASGARTDTVESWPLLHDGDEIGRLVVASRGAREELSAADRRVLGDVARQLSIAAYALLVTEDLRRSRERLRSVLEEERRRIRRDLHDGLGPSLATVVLGIEEARNRFVTDPEAGNDLLRELKVQTQAAIRDIRALVYDLRPPALDELGLVPALREQIARFADTGEVELSLDAPGDVPVLPAAVEVAAFRIVQEAVTNVLKHAHATRCTVRIAAGEDLVVEIADDGVGISPEPSVGVGIRSMRERAAELDGSLAISSDERGTRIVARFPLVPL